MAPTEALMVLRTWEGAMAPTEALMEERCGWVSTRQRPIGEGWENNELRVELVVSSRAPGLAACEGGRYGSDVVAASIAAVRQCSCGVL